MSAAAPRRVNNREKSGPLELVIQGVAAGIGLASEAYQHNKEKKRLRREEEQRQNGQGSSPATPDSQASASLAITPPAIGPNEVEEITWDLDEAQREISPHSPSESLSQQDVSELATSFITSHPLPGHPVDGTAPPATRGGLSLPVVLTQRRPKARDRGFIRAYAPVLEQAGIDEPTFLEFVDKLNTATEPSPWLHAINLAGFAGMAVPEPFNLLVSIAVSMVTSAAMEAHSRGKTNKFLDKVNAEFFRPRGLVCLIVTWKPEAVGSFVTQVDFEGRIREASSPAPTGMLEKATRTLQSSDVQDGFDGFEWPEVAPLIFPGLAEPAQAGDGKKEGRMKRAGKFIDDYMDRRALAKWAGANPDSKLANMAPSPTFRSRFADPNHPASSGHPLALLTGGYINPPKPQRPPAKDERSLSDLRNTQERRRLERAHTQGVISQPEQPGLIGRAVGISLSPLALIDGARNLLKKDILYLMVVNLPTEQELAQARAILADLEGH